MPEGGIKKWYRLDNAAKIYPATKTSVWAAIFRISVTFKSEIDLESLQTALERTAKRMPLIAAKIRRGMFWYYLEPSDKVPKLQEDVQNPCMKMSKEENDGFSFRVRVYNKRVSLEVYHALADGFGGFAFMKTMCAEYLRIKGYEVPYTRDILNCSESPRPEELEDGHNKFSKFRINEKRMDKKAYYVKGTKENFDVINIISGSVPCDILLQKAKEKKLSATEYLAGILCNIIYKIQEDENPKRKRPVMILLPVNLRAFYPSDSMRNFTYFVLAGIDPNYGEFTQEEIFSEIHHSTRRALNEKYLNAKISKNVSIERNPMLRIVPLFIKKIAMRITYMFVGENRSSTTISNMGKVDLPKEMEAHIDKVDFYLSRSRFTNINCAMGSYGDKMIINFTRAIKEPYVERAFFRELVKQGIPVVIESNRIYEEEEG